MNITRKDLPKANTQAQSQFNNEFLKVFKQCKRRPQNIEVLKATLKKAHALCGEFEKEQKVKGDKIAKRKKEALEAKKAADIVAKEEANKKKETK